MSREIEIVSQEDRTVLMAFTTENALKQFGGRLSTLVEGGVPTCCNLIYALRAFNSTIGLRKIVRVGLVDQRICFSDFLGLVRFHQDRRHVLAMPAPRRL